jgi:uncharacterized protein (TIGR00661 family)
MARIWYSVLGDGMGHAIRSETVIEHLRQNHDVLITAAGRAYPYLKKKFGNSVHEIMGLTLIYEDNRVRFGKTLGDFIKKIPGFRDNIDLIGKLLTDFRPHVLISDFEPFADYFAKLIKLPRIAVDNIHILSECKIKADPQIKYKFSSASAFIRMLHPPADYYLIPAFADILPRKARSQLVDPIVRKEVKALVPEQKDQVLVYQTSKSNTRMLQILQRTSRKYVVYGMGRRKNRRNIKFREFTQEEFLEDLRTCSYVIINGGFTVMSEALYLKKPVLAIPIGKQFEQEFNGFCLKMSGYGDYTTDFVTSDLLNFEHNLHIYRQNLVKLKRWDDKKLFDSLEKLIVKCMKQKPNYEELARMLRIYGQKKRIEKK